MKNYYWWQRDINAVPQIVEIVEDDFGKHIKTFDGAYTETVYGNLLEKIEFHE